MKKIFIMTVLFFALALFITAEDSSYEFLDDDNFYEVTGDEIYIVDFYADWCGPCRQFAPTFEAVANDLDTYNFAKVDVDESTGVSSDFAIQYIPYIAAVRNGKVVEEYQGSRTAEDFTRWVERVYSRY